MPNPDSPLVKPEVVFIEELFDESCAGKLRIPKFQRPFVWSPSDMLSLFDSIYRGYPIGSLLLWETTERAQSLNQVGPHEIPDPPNGQLTYVLDGQQRLATLFGVLRLGSDVPLDHEEKNWRWWIWFDLKTCEFTHVTNGKPPNWYMPLRAVLKTVDFLEEARRLQRECGDAASKYIANAERLAQTIKNYKVALIRIKGGMLSDAVDIFSRLNSKGQRMTLDQMVSALTYSEGTNSINLAGRIDTILENLSEFHFGNTNRLTIFRSIVAAAGLDMHTAEWENLATRLKGSDLTGAIDKAEAALIASTQFLREQIRVPSDRLLPYTNQLLLLSRFFDECPHPGIAQRQTLVKWFWVTSLSGWFAGANSTKINSALEEMSVLARNPLANLRVMPLDDPPQPFPKRFDLRSARIRSLLLILLRTDPLSPENGTPINVAELIRDDEHEAFQYVFTHLDRSLVSSPANRILLKRLPRTPVKDRLLSIPPLIAQPILDSHAISPEAHQALNDDDAERFLRLRVEEMANRERVFLASLGITAPPNDLLIGEFDVWTSGDEDAE